MIHSAMAWMIHILLAIFKPAFLIRSVIFIIILLVVFLYVRFNQLTNFVDNLDIEEPAKDKDRDISDPSRLEIKLNVFTTCYLLNSAYEKYIDGMNLTGNEKVLDFGSGPGSAAQLIAPKLISPGGQLTCLDISPTWMKVIKSRLSDHRNIQFKLGDIRRLELEKESFDIILIHFVLHDIDPGIRQEIIRRLTYLLKVGGRLYIREPRSNLHGMQAPEIQHLMQQAGLHEERLKASRISLVIPVNEGIYIKKS
jgi:SAM-dependent methyltransferase